MLIIIKDNKVMTITRQNPKGGPALKGFPLAEDPDTGQLGYKVGYCDCGCGRPLLIRTLDVRAVIEKFGRAVDDYESWFSKLKPKESIRHKIVRFLGGQIGD